MERRIADWCPTCPLMKVPALWEASGSCGRGCGSSTEPEVDAVDMDILRTGGGSCTATGECT